MRFLHTADWHLGRTLGGAPFLPEQEWLLCGAFLDMVRETRPDAVIIAGDIFDRAVPPTDAVRLLDDLLGRIIRGLGVPVVLIPGNHDDPARLSFGASLLRASGLHIADSALGVPFPLADAHGEVWIAPSGYASPPLLAQLLGDPALPDHDQGVSVLCQILQAQIPDSEALDTAMEVLMSLPGRDRLVGVVSHVDSLRDRIPVRLEVTPGRRGSTAAFRFG